MFMKMYTTPFHNSQEYIFELNIIKAKNYIHISIATYKGTKHLRKYLKTVFGVLSSQTNIDLQSLHISFMGM